MEESALTALVERVAKHAKTSTNDDYVRECTEQGIALVNKHIGAALLPIEVYERGIAPVETYGVARVPREMYERAVIETAADLFWRRNAQSGIAQFQSGEGLELMRIGADPLHAARIILRPWTGVPIA